MRKPKLYLETSVWNFLFADDAPDKKHETEKFFGEIEAGKYEIYISETVRAEIFSAPSSKKEKLDGAIDKYKPVELELDEDVRQLAQFYLDNGVLSAKHINDLLHLSYASVNGLYALVSWNLNHLVKMKTHSLGNAVNYANGYHEILIFTPQGVIELED